QQRSHASHQGVTEAERDEMPRQQQPQDRVIPPRRHQPLRGGGARLADHRQRVRLLHVIIFHVGKSITFQLGKSMLGGHAGSSGARTTATGRVAWWSTAWLIEPSNRPRNLPRPREPTTTSAASRPWSNSTSAG